MASKLDLGCYQGRGARKEQEDYFATSDTGTAVVDSHHGFLAVVADGMGGHSDGALASLTAVNRFVAEYATKAPEESVPDALQRALLKANRALLSKIKKKGNGSDMGTTLVACVCQGGRLYWVSVGDSRLFRLRQGVLEAINQDHSYGAELDAKYAAGQISASRLGAESSKRHMLTSYIGIDPIPKINLSHVALDLQAGDQILLCTDGLTNTLQEHEIARCLAASSTAQEKCEEMGALVGDKNRPRQDNLTMVLVDMKAVDQAGIKPDFKQRDHRIKMGAMIFAAVLAVTFAAGAVIWWRKSSDEVPVPAPQTAKSSTLPKASAEPERKQAAQAAKQPKGESSSSPAQAGGAVTPAPAGPAAGSDSEGLGKATPAKSAASPPAAAPATSGEKLQATGMGAKTKASLIPPAPTAEAMDLKTAQKILKGQGLYGDSIDGLLGPNTRAAIKKFQRKHNIKPVSGVLDPQTVKALRKVGGQKHSQARNIGSPVRAEAPTPPVSRAPPAPAAESGQASNALTTIRPTTSATEPNTQKLPAEPTPATGEAATQTKVKPDGPEADGASGTNAAVPSGAADSSNQAASLTGGGPAPETHATPQTAEANQPQITAAPATSDPKKAASKKTAKAASGQGQGTVFSDGTE
ncbi:MAG: protein phosphatase 2C domain-containing protein [Desulfarculaceae bacterium]|nr:protein phosphatase 2C domain-containing protein [Desulfarculaceae bacterium]MCF8072136.1 protein phosphatase 2C domain-containing protein [Desulfarculaceae bacterium]MCF8100057.1 protein phosphatase 2C domain-containing protein [Desulfarculaceae bacterium]MCF8118264.1 protein phosphatase 2C domain-containing protein [Desulfarculaceae bacterium]